MATNKTDKLYKDEDFFLILHPEVTNFVYKWAIPFYE